MREHPSDDGVRIRRLADTDAADALGLFAMMADVFEEPMGPVSEAYVARLLARPDVAVFAAVLPDGTPVGGATTFELPMFRHEGGELLLWDLAVLPEQQRRGIGRRLMEAVQAHARARGLACTFLFADDEDLHAIDFYRAIGGRAAPVTMFTWDAD